MRISAWRSADRKFTSPWNRGWPSSARARIRLGAPPAAARTASTTSAPASTTGGRSTVASRSSGSPMTVSVPIRLSFATRSWAAPPSRPSLSQTTWPGAPTVGPPGPISGSRAARRSVAQGFGCRASVKSRAWAGVIGAGGRRPAAARAVVTTTTGRSVRSAWSIRLAITVRRPPQLRAAAHPSSMTRTSGPAPLRLVAALSNGWAAARDDRDGEREAQHKQPERRFGRTFLAWREAQKNADGGKANAPGSRRRQAQKPPQHGQQGERRQGPGNGEGDRADAQHALTLPGRRREPGTAPAAPFPGAGPCGGWRRSSRSPAPWPRRPGCGRSARRGSPPAPPRPCR